MQTNLRYSLIAFLLLGLCPAHIYAQDSLEERQPEAASRTGTTAETEPAAPPSPKDAKRKWLFRGFATEEYRFRHASQPEYPAIEGETDEASTRETDHDVFLFLNGHLSEDRDQFSADLSMGVWYDLGGSKTPSSDPSAFGSVNDHQTPEKFHDAYDVYSLYAEYTGRGLLSLARGGRQTSEYGRPTTFDGATIQLSVLKPYLDIAVFGGRTVHFFDLEDNLFENWLAAAVAIVRPVPALRLEAEYRFLREHSLFQKDINDHSYGLTAWYRLTEQIWLKGYVRGLNDTVSEVGVDNRLAWPNKEIGADLSVQAQLVPLGEVNENNNPYFGILGRSLPYIRFRANVWKEFTTRAGSYGLHLGWNGRLLTEDDSAPFNRNFGRAYLLCQATDIGVKGPFANAVVEYHHPLGHSDITKDNLFTVGGSAGYEWKQLKGEVGSYYYRYKYDYYRSVKEKENIRIYYGEFRYDVLEWLSIRLRYEYERFDRDLHTVAVKLTQIY